jgi:hypothetical protein
LLQIWLLPEARGLTPGYEQKSFSGESYLNQFALLASRHGDHGSVTIHQDVKLYRAKISQHSTLKHTLSPSRKAYLHIIDGALMVNDHYQLSAGDALKVSGENELSLVAQHEAECILFDLPH